jgi:hypothetical protein
MEAYDNAIREEARRPFREEAVRKALVEKSSRAAEKAVVLAPGRAAAGIELSEAELNVMLVIMMEATDNIADPENATGYETVSSVASAEGFELWHGAFAKLMRASSMLENADKQTISF